MECHVGISLNRTKTRVRVMDTLKGAAPIATFIGVSPSFAEANEDRCSGIHNDPHAGWGQPRRRQDRAYML